jgi:hypothetical protein
VGQQVGPEPLGAVELDPAALAAEDQAQGDHPHRGGAVDATGGAARLVGRVLHGHGLHGNHDRLGLAPHAVTSTTVPAPKPPDWRALAALGAIMHGTGPGALRHKVTDQE